MTFLDSEIPALLGQPLAALLFTCVGVPLHRTKRAGTPRDPADVSERSAAAGIRPVWVWGTPENQKAPDSPSGAVFTLRSWSGRSDSNARPPEPHSGALPGCATPRRGAESSRRGSAP